MIIVKLTRGLRRTRKHSNCEGWITNAETGDLQVHTAEREPMAVYARGTWVSVEDVKS